MPDFDCWELDDVSSVEASKRKKRGVVCGSLEVLHTLEKKLEQKLQSQAFLRLDQWRDVLEHLEHSQR